jgi:hypothetical protein
MAPPNYSKMMERSRELLTKERILAGAEYVQRLRQLGFDPDIAAWVYRGIEDDIQLVLVSDIVLRVGSRRMYEVLFQAYENAITPKHIDPFDVGLYSSKMDLSIDLTNQFAVMTAEGMVRFGEEDVEVMKTVFVVGVNYPKIVYGVGVYRVKRNPAKMRDISATWRTFERNIEQMAA